MSIRWVIEQNKTGKTMLKSTNCANIVAFDLIRESKRSCHQMCAYCCFRCVLPKLSCTLPTKAINPVHNISNLVKQMQKRTEKQSRINKYANISACLAVDKWEMVCLTQVYRTHSSPTIAITDHWKHERRNEVRWTSMKGERKRRHITG